MKKFMIYLCSLAIIFGLAAPALAIPFTDIQDLNVKLAEGPIAEFFYPTTYTYNHNTPSDFEVPFDIVTSATLEISGYKIDDNNDQVAVSGTAVGTLTPGGSYGSFLWWSWDTPALTKLDISSVFTSWDTGDTLAITISAAGDFPDGYLELATSKFTLNYENNTAPVPEPATMFLLGTGLIGLVATNRKRFHKKN